MHAMHGALGYSQGRLQLPPGLLGPPLPSTLSLAWCPDPQIPTLNPNPDARASPRLCTHAQMLQRACCTTWHSCKNTSTHKPGMRPHAAFNLLSLLRMLLPARRVTQLHARGSGDMAGDRWEGEANGEGAEGETGCGDEG